MHYPIYEWIQGLELLKVSEFIRPKYGAVLTFFSYILAIHITFRHIRIMVANFNSS